jgi:osmoprotectant transport system permease protein
MNFFDEVRRYLDVNHADVVRALVEHVYLALVPVVIAFAIALPIGWAVVRYSWLRQPVLTFTSVVYTIPSLALLLLLPGVLGTPILGSINVVIALSIYTVALLVRTTADALESVDAGIVEAATAMGYKPVRRWFAVELPLALPVVLAGVRVATVANVSLVSVAALIGVGGLGQLFTRGVQLNFYAPPIVIGLVLSVALAVVADTLIVLVQRMLTPWVRIGGAR